MKSMPIIFEVFARRVAPLVGAWIEIFNSWCCGWSLSVAPLVGAWIEIITHTQGEAFQPVAPLVGAWIEISASCDVLTSLMSLLL